MSASRRPILGTPSSSSAVLTVAQREAGASRSRVGQPYRWRGRLPHFDATHVCQFVTFRLADSLPQAKLRELEAELRGLPDEARDRERRKRIEGWLDSGIGCCALAHAAVAQVVHSALQRFDGERYRLFAWCIMPNHVHVLMETLVPMAKTVQSWKSFTGRWTLQHAAELELGVPGKAFWMRDYWDRYVRNERHFRATVEYIHANPVNAGLCRAPGDWRWSSAWAQSEAQEARDVGPQVLDAEGVE